MTSLTDRLRDYGAKFSQIDLEYLMCIEAAAEIERLRAAQQDGAEALKHDVNRYVQIATELATANELALAELKRLHERNGWRTTADVIRRLEQASR